MAAPTFDTHDAVRKLRGAGIDEQAAEGIVEVVEEATSPLVTRDILRLELGEFRSELRSEIRSELHELRSEQHEFRSEMYRALWIQGAGVVAAISGLAATAVAVAALLG